MSRPGDPPPPPPPPDPRHPVDPRRPRSWVGLVAFARRYPRYREPLPAGIKRRLCRRGRLAASVLGWRHVLSIAAEGGLVPYLARRAAAVFFPARSPEVYR
jgi:hypothetical protein